MHTVNRENCLTIARCCKKNYIHSSCMFDHDNIAVCYQRNMPKSSHSFPMCISAYQVCITLLQSALQGGPLPAFAAWTQVYLVLFSSPVVFKSNLLQSIFSSLQEEKCYAYCPLLHISGYIPKCMCETSYCHMRAESGPGKTSSY